MNPKIEALFQLLIGLAIVYVGQQLFAAAKQKLLS
jgi:hypothetical protein